MHRTRTIGALACVAALAATGTASAATVERVTESDVAHQPENTSPTNDWVIFTRTASSLASFAFGPADAPLGAGSLELQTPGGGDKVFAFNYDHTGTPLGDVDDLAYSTYRAAGSAQQVAALNLQIDSNGPEADGGFATLVFEPVYNTAQGAVSSGEWQDWTADGAGRWWSTRPLGGGQGAGATTVNMRTWDQIVAANPDAVIGGGVGVNQGSGNAGLVTSVDAFSFDETTYDFEPSPASMDDCKDGGWESYADQFKNQGDCVSSFAPGQQDQA